MKTTTKTPKQPKRPKLPPDTDGMNDDRASWAQDALDTFQSVTNSDDEDAICDLLADLMHLCDRQQGDCWDVIMERARMHYEAETEK